MTDNSPAPSGATPPVGSRWRHKKRGTVYEVVRHAEVQCEAVRGEGLTDFEVVVVYRGLDDDRTWVRRPSEFLDGRFEPIAALRQTEGDAKPTPACDERELAALIARYYRGEIGRLMQQAEHWAANDKPLAAHVRLHTADAYFQIVALCERFAEWGVNPFSEMRAELERSHKPHGAYPPSTTLHKYRDPVNVAAMLAASPATPPTPKAEGVQYDQTEPCPVCGPHPFAGIRDEGCLLPATKCPRYVQPTPYRTSPPTPAPKAEGELQGAAKEVHSTLMLSSSREADIDALIAFAATHAKSETERADRAEAKARQMEAYTLKAQQHAIDMGFKALAAGEAAAAIRSASPAAELTEMQRVKLVCETLGFDPINHHNAALCPYCSPAPGRRGDNAGENADSTLEAPRETWIVDEPEGGPVGILIDFPDGRQIWSGEASKALFDAQGDEIKDSLGGNDCGIFVMSSKNDGAGAEIVCRAASAEVGMDIAQALARTEYNRLLAKKEDGGG